MQVDGEAVEWDVKYYDVLQNTVGGGKPKMRWHFTNTAKAWPTSTLGAAPADEAGQTALIDALQVTSSLDESDGAPTPASQVWRHI